jgi:D-alanyl-D-alanine carboxypeptidase
MGKRCVLLFSLPPRDIIYAAGMAAVAAAAVFLPDTAFARHHHHFHRMAAGNFHHAAGFTAPSAAIVVDANSGKVLYAQNENELRHPASITKVMTLYLLFEQLEKGRFRLDTPLKISAHAADQAPSRLGLQPGDTIRVEDAIKAVVTKSANDIAVAIAENIAGDEDSFAELMTRKAHALGMSRTQYRNSSGLPNDEQLTTAADLALLGRAIQERFPTYYKYFSTRTFYFAGAALRNHNHLLGRLDGVDGIKTGYTRASGFNLLTSVRRAGHHIIAVVLGGKSAAQRDRLMANLVSQHIAGSSTVVSNQAVAQLEPTDSPKRPMPDVTVAAVTAGEPGRTQTAARTDKDLARFSPDKPRPAVISGGYTSASAVAAGSIDHRPLGMDGSTNARSYAAVVQPVASASATPPNLRWVRGPQALAQAPGRALDAINAADSADAPAETKVAKAGPIPAAGRPAAARTGWMIQIGATEDVDKAQALLARAKTEGRGLLRAAEGFTEKIQKGDAVLYRARFAGLEPNAAEAVCKTLKKSGFACFPTKN